MAQTANYGFEKPSTDKNVDEEFYQLQETLDLLDAILAALQTAVNGKSAVGHTHAIGDVVNLAAELAAKMPASQTFKLDDLTDVDGADDAPNGYVLVKSALGWLPSSALAALGPHGHLISEVTGLVDALAGKADAAATTAALAGKQDAATAVTLTGTQTLTDKTLTGPVVNAPQGEFLRGRLNGLTLSNNASDANNDIDVSTGAAGSDGVTPALMVLSSAITKRLDAAWAVGNNNGGLDTGSKAINTWYYLWLIQRSDTGVVDALFSTSATSPTMPANYDRKFRLPGAIRTDGSGNIRAFKQRGRRRFEFAARIDDISVASQVTTPILRTITVPPNMIGILQVQFAGAEYLEITNPDQPVINESATAGTTFVTSDRAGIRLNQSVDGASQIRTKVNVGSIPMYISTLGFEDPEV